MNVLVINYGLGNIGSVRRAFEECGAEVRVSSNPADLLDADRIVLPGVGAFVDGMVHLTTAGWPDRIREALKTPSVQLLGICLGMQLLADIGLEGGEETQGLGFIPGKVERLEPKNGERVPHVGWNSVYTVSNSPLLAGIDDGTDFYYVHSYHYCAQHPKHVLATSPYCGEFAAVIGLGNVYGTQFHPEKSSKSGLHLIRNFLKR